jgi:hypothetical protein
MAPAGETPALPAAAAIRAARNVNVVLAGVDTALAFLLLARLVAFPAALGAAALLALYPAWMRDSAQPLTEPLFLAFWIGALLLFYSPREGPVTPSRAALLGLLGGLAYLTRPSGLLLPLFFTLALLPPLAARACSLARSAPSIALPRVLPFLWGGFLLAWLPYGAALAMETGSPFTSILSYNFSIRHIYEGTLYGFERSFSPPLAFVTARPAEIAALISEQTVVLLTALGRSLRFLLPLALFLRFRDLRRHADLWLLAVLNFGFHAVAWTVWGAGRYLLPTYLLVAALLLTAPLSRVEEAGTEDRPAKRWGFRLAATAAWLAAVAACLAGDVRLHREKALPYAGVKMGWAYRAAAKWLREGKEDPEAVVASNQPWILNLLSEQPARIAPRFRDAPQARRFSARYPSRWLVYFAEEPEDFAVLDRIAPERRGRRAIAPELQNTWVIARYAERHVAPDPHPGARLFARGLVDQRLQGRTGMLLLERR